MNPNKKSDLTIRYLHHFQEKFASVIQMHTKIIEEFGSQVPDSVTFNLVYFEGQRHAKMAIVSDDDEVAEIFKELKKQHEDRYDIPKLRLWARMVAGNLHESLTDPPHIPAFGSPKKAKRDSFSSALGGAATAFANVMMKSQQNSCIPPMPVSVMPATATTDIRYKNLQQLRYIKELRDDGILTDGEYTDQKENILHAIKEL